MKSSRNTQNEKRLSISLGLTARYILIIACIFLANFSYSQDDDDPNVGFYADGVKVKELTCYSFKTLTVVFPYNNAYALYDKFGIAGKTGKDFGISAYISKPSFLSKIKGKYIVYEIYSAGVEYANDTYATRGALAYYQQKNEAEYEFVATLDGHKISGYTETYDQGCSCYRREPEYEIEKIASLTLPLKNRVQKKSLYKIPGDMPVDMNQSCVYVGNKVDFKNLGKTSSSNSSNNPKVTENTEVKTTNNSSGNTVANNSSAGNAGSTKVYTEKHSNGKISMQGQKNSEGNEEGLWKYFDETGKLEKSITYKNGIQDGESKYFENGKVFKTQIFKMGELISEKDH